MDRFDALEAFVAVVEAGQFSAAAERLNIGKSVLSRRISDLEARLGAQLLRRTTRSLSLTEAGRLFYRRASDLLAELEDAEQSVGDEQQGLAGRMRMAAPLSFGLAHLVPLLTAFLHQHPDLQLDLDLDDREVNLVEEGVDLAVRIGSLADSTLVARPLAPIRFLACASPAYLARNGTPQRPEELSGHLGLVYSNLADPDHWTFVDKRGESITVKVPVYLRANNGEALISAAADGLGIVLTPTFAGYRAIIDGRLQAILTNFRLPAVNAYAIYPSRRYVPRRVKVMVEYLRSQFGEQPYWDAGLFE
ncbi:MAG: LysR family transcriptional regulator [Chromatiales bacterium]|nr:LysR family transcriptional regulator [Chromatiales bacterium]